LSQILFASIGAQTLRRFNPQLILTALGATVIFGRERKTAHEIEGSMAATI